jgi:GTP-binding protein
MRVTKAEYIKSAVTPEQYPVHKSPEIAFAGRSNVGKSSLINILAGRKGLVKVSKTPGKTQLLNFFTINDKIVFVDMPGYGFAKVPNEVKKTWGTMVETYLQTSGLLKGAIVLLDARRNPNDDDLNLLDWLRHYDIPVIIVFTKIDKIPITRRHGAIKQALAHLRDHAGANVKVVQFSALNGDGKKELWSAITRLAGIGPDHHIMSKGGLDKPPM